MLEDDIQRAVKTCESQVVTLDTCDQTKKTNLEETLPEAQRTQKLTP